jgi:hypothetical protein
MYVHDRVHVHACSRNVGMDIDMGMDMDIGMDTDTDTDIFEGKICLIGYRTPPKLGLSNIGIDLNLYIVAGPIQKTDLMPK